MAKLNTLSLTPVKGGFQLNGVIPFEDFSAEKQGDAYEITVDGEKQTKVPTPRREFSKSVTPVDVIWPDGKIRTMSLRIKANAPMLPEEYQTRTAQAQESRALSGLKKLSPEQRKKALEMLLEDETEPAETKVS
jgi:hypothetical protein